MFVPSLGKFCHVIINKKKLINLCTVTISQLPPLRKMEWSCIRKKIFPLLKDNL